MSFRSERKDKLERCPDALEHRYIPLTVGHLEKNGINDRGCI